MNKALIAIAALTLTGCMQLNLEREHGYQVQSVNGQAVLAGTRITLTLDKDGRIYGNAGCNHFFGTYHLDDKALTFSQLGSTRRLCAEPVMAQEYAFLERLSRNVRWSNSHDQLKLMSKTREPVVLIRDKH